MKSPKKKPAAARLRSWRVSILRARGQNLGTIEAPDATAEQRARDYFDALKASPVEGATGD
jgi:hypothetical protein